MYRVNGSSTPLTGCGWTSALQGSPSRIAVVEPEEKLPDMGGHCLHHAIHGISFCGNEFHGN